MKELLERTREIIQTNQYINIATVGPDQLPWNTPVYARSDSNMQFYWSSWIGAQHSLNLRQNKAACVTIYDSTRIRGDNNRRCVYIQGEVNELQDALLVQPILTLLYNDESKNMSVKEYTEDGIKRIYRFSPKQFWLNDLSERHVTGETVKMRIEVPFEALVAS